MAEEGQVEEKGKEPAKAQKKRQQRGKRLRLLFQLEAAMEAPMFVLALVWLWLFIAELIRGLSVFQERLLVAVWILFIAEFVLKLYLAPNRRRHLLNNWLTAISLVIPAFRTFRLLRALRLLRGARVVSTTRFVRALSSTSRFISDLRDIQGPEPVREMNVGILLCCSRQEENDSIAAFAAQLGIDGSRELRDASGIPWHFHQPGRTSLESDTPQRASDFLASASRHMAEGPYDLVLVITDVALVSRSNRVEAGLVSEVCRIAVISARQLTGIGRDEPERELDSPESRWNATALLLHLVGHINGLPHQRPDSGALMAPFRFRKNRRGPVQFNSEERRLLQKRAARLPERELRGGTVLETLIFHLIMMLRHPKDLFRSLLKSRALLLPLALPGLATAAVAPALLLVFTAEIWDVGLNMSNRTAVVYALLSIIAASFYLVSVQSLFLPRKDKRVLTEHLAVANVVIFLSVMTACVGLFLLVGGLMLIIELYIFPEGLMQTWPTLDQQSITLSDQLRLASFISTVGVTTGALAGGLESKTVIRHLALFRNDV